MIDICLAIYTAIQLISCRFILTRDGPRPANRIDDTERVNGPDARVPVVAEVCIRVHARTSIHMHMSNARVIAGRMLSKINEESFDFE